MKIEGDTVKSSVGRWKDSSRTFLLLLLLVLVLLLLLWLPFRERLIKFHFDLVSSRAQFIKRIDYAASAFTSISNIYVNLAKDRSSATWFVSNSNPYDYIANIQIWRWAGREIEGGRGKR